LFSRVPQCRGIVTFVQIAVPTRPEIPDYQQYRAHFESAVGIVNETFGTDEWQPIVCRTEPLSRQELVAYYLAADVACVTPVADGMNLVALEYCASRTGNDGVLVLSRQAGASALLGESAVTVDARRTESIVGGLVQALTMPGTERARRMTELRSVVMRSSSEQWLRRCLADIEPAAANLPPGRTVN
jgi:trehalose-6-phosphate synthase